jgi:tRNA nucleotidyltransferase (CCA-adding enzyme)
MHISLHPPTVILLDILADNGAKSYIYGAGLIRSIQKQQHNSVLNVLTTALPQDVLTTLIDAGYFAYESDSFINASKENDCYRITPVHCLEKYFETLDFTINGALADKDGIIINKYFGIEDIQRKIIRLVNKKTDYLQHHKIKKLQAVRYISQLPGFSVDANLLAAMKKDSDLIDVAPKLIADELNLLLMGSNVRESLRLLQTTSLLKTIFPALDACVGVSQNEYHTKDVYNHIVDVVSNTVPDLVLRLAALFHDICKPECKIIKDGKIRFPGHDKRSAEVCREILTFYGYDSAVMDKVTLLIEYHMKKKKMTDKQLLDMICKCRPENMDDIFTLQFADNAATLVTDRDGMIYNKKRAYELLNNKNSI